jgi:hypothetical protein
MYNISIVCTHHSELGKCNSDALYSIIESIHPDIIFEELNQELFDMFYQENRIPFDSPETKTVKRYLENNDVRHLPTEDYPNDSLSINEIRYMFNALNKYHVYSNLEEKHKKLISENGYTFLNSKKNEMLFEEKKALEKSLIASEINRLQLSRINDLFYEELTIREHQIIKNVYNYSTKMEYNQAILLIGSGHRKTIFEKVKIYECENELKLKWSLFGD